MRPHVSLVVSAFDDSDATLALKLLGATTTFIQGEHLIDTLRLGGSSRLTADAIVIDSTTNPLQGEDIGRSIGLGTAVRRLSDATMRTGVRWSALPIIVIVTNAAFEYELRSYGLGDRIVPCAKDLGWPRVYDRIAHEVLEFSLEVVRQMRELGWDLGYHRGRWIRLRAKLPQRRGGHRRDFESEYYDGTADQWLREKSVVAKRRLAMAAFDATMTLQDALYLQSLIVDPGVTEPALQRLIEEAPYLLQSARLELIAKPTFIQESTGNVKSPDLVYHPVFRDSIDITELKLPRATLVAHRGKLVYQSAEITAGAAQVREYAEIAVDTSHRSRSVRRQKQT